MTAYPEQTDLQSVFRQVARRSTVASDREVSDGAGQWRVVAVDGSTSTVDRSAEGRLDEQSDRQLSRSQQTVAMPTAVTDCSEMIGGTVGQSRRDGARGGLKLGAVVLLSGNAQSGVACGGVRSGGASKSILPPRASAGCRDIDSQLARIIDVWPDLPRSIRAAILAMIETVREEDP